MMRRTNSFSIKFRDDVVFEIADNCSQLWNTVNYKRRQSFFKGKIDWTTNEEYKQFSKQVGSATAQQIIRKNNNAWKSFFALLRLSEQGKLPQHIQRIRPPGYWKDRDTGRRKLKVLIRNDCYQVKGRSISLPRELKGRIYGHPHWNGKQGQLELSYDRSMEKWYAYQSVLVEARHQPTGNKRAYVDLGVRYIITGYIEGGRQAMAYDGTPPLTDWWYWNSKIAEHQSTLKNVNNKHSSKQLSTLYCIRQRRFRQVVNTYIHRFIEYCWRQGVSEVIVGDLTGIRNNDSKGRKVNTMINNFWSHKYIADRLNYTSENYGIKLKFIDERGTSSRCPWCGSTDYTRGGRLFKCYGCGVEAHRDVVGTLNIGLVHGLREGDINRVMAHPVVASCPSHQQTSNCEGNPTL